MEKTTNVKFAGLGGQGVIRASDILAEAVFRAGKDVKKSELHGMSQRGGSVSSDVRFGAQVWSPMIPDGEADYLVVISPDQVENNLPALKKGGVLLRPEMIDENALPNKRSLNVALLGALSKLLPLPEGIWLDALREAFAPEFFPNNEKAFQLGRSAKQV
ncbi:MAG: 2-oxoacid:acceptor oxidoreductase family protein [Anaerolineales bacterium]|jgi:indolepyruvate ferredoxin oxidoreductase beta subunit